MRSREGSTRAQRARRSGSVNGPKPWLNMTAGLPRLTPAVKAASTYTENERKVSPTPPAPLTAIRSALFSAEQNSLRGVESRPLETVRIRIRVCSSRGLNSRSRSLHWINAGERRRIHRCRRPSTK